MSDEIVSGGVIEITEGEAVTSDEQPDVRVILKAGGKLQTVKVTHRKTDREDDVLITVNKSTTVVWEIE